MSNLNVCISYSPYITSLLYQEEVTKAIKNLQCKYKSGDNFYSRIKEKKLSCVMVRLNSTDCN